MQKEERERERVEEGGYLGKGFCFCSLKVREVVPDSRGVAKGEGGNNSLFGILFVLIQAALLHQ